MLEQIDHKEQSAFIRGMNRMNDLAIAQDLRHTATNQTISHQDSSR